MSMAGVTVTDQRELHGVQLVALGSLAGLCHAVAESTLLGWIGIAIRPLDHLLLAVSYVLLGALGGALLALLIPLLRRVTRHPGRADTYLFFLIVVAGVNGFLAGAQVLALTSRIHSTVALAFLTLILLLFATLTYRRPRTPGIMLAFLLGTSFAATGASFSAGLWPEIHRYSLRLDFALSLCLPVLISLAFLIVSPASSKRRARSVPCWLLWTGILYGVHLALWFLIWPAEIGWHIDRPSASSHARGPERPKILMVVLDTVRAQNIELFGYARQTMPFLTGFARKECDFVTAALANAAETLPSHASMFTGHFVYSHRAHKASLAEHGVSPAYLHPLDDRHPTLSRWLGQHGYETAAISANYGQLSGYGLRRGFGHFDCLLSDSHLCRQLCWLFTLRSGDHALGATMMYRLPDRLTAASVAFTCWQPGYRSAQRIVGLAIDWLSQQGERPSFLFLNLMDAHDPYLPPPEYRERFGKRDPSITWMGFPAALRQRAQYQGQPFPRKDLDFAISQYDAELAYLDDQLRRLFTYLRTAGQLEKTLVIIVGDHGEGFWEHGALQHGTTLYNTQTRVPLLIKFPAGGNAGPPPPAPHIQPVDIMPTIAQLLGLESPAGVQGSPWGGDRSYALAENYVHWARHPKFHRELVAVEAGGIKYIQSTSGEEELYDLRVDPHETRNLITVRPEVAARLRALIEPRREALSRQPPVREAQPEDDALREKLRSLGYL
ncbi:MAG: sulfatase-like hydrolase/transferase [Candidatus Eisenbacteria sp.]|nr:sulfatase-like hydrolase/transferase [Candidatus Eisenbacteria bacterium]